ncbi:MAG: carbohydrate kinase family protein [Erysipelotrichaceae bacterium]|nr:carbohydrate kinase family protein [Erysipelotrichaceae bacterium]
MEKYLLSILGSSVDYFYESDTYPEEGDFSHARTMGISAGGCPLNVGAVCASKGNRVIALDMLGKDDDTTDFLLKEMKRLHYETDHIEIKEGVSNGKVLIILTKDKRTMFVIDPKRPKYTVDERMQELLNNATYIYSLMHMINRSFENIDPLLEAKRHGAKVILDGSSKYDDPSRARILYSVCDGLFINRTDYKRLSKVSQKDPIETILSSKGEFVIITDGSKGSTLYLKDKTIYRPALSDLKVLDSTGAGDAFAGCFIAALLSGYNYEKALSLATINGAYACTVFGGLGGVASFEQLIDFAKENDYEL